MSQRPTQVWKVVAVFFSGISLLMLSFALLLPRTYYVSRTVVITANADEVFAAISDPHTWPTWAVWLHDLDPTLKVTFADTAEGPQVRFSGKRLGDGRFVMIDQRKPAELTVRAFLGTTGSSGLHRFQIASEGEATRVVWSMIGEVGDGFLDALTVGTRERLAVRDFDTSLAALKTCVESHNCL